MTTGLDDQLNATVSIPVHLLQYIDQECIIDNADDEAREAFNAALDRAFPDGPPGGCGGYISWDLREPENVTPRQGHRENGWPESDDLAAGTTAVRLLLLDCGHVYWAGPTWEDWPNSGHLPVECNACHELAPVRHYIDQQALDA